MIVSWQWLPFATLILLTAFQSLDSEQLEAAEMDGAPACALLLHRAAASEPRDHHRDPDPDDLPSGVFAEIFVTTGGAFGTRTLTYLIYQRVLESQNVGLGSAGGVYAIILANIVALFLMRIVGKNLDAEEGHHGTRRHHTTQGAQHRPRLAIGLLIFFPILWTILTSFKTEAEAIANPPVFLFFDWTLENYGVVQERSNYMRFLVELGHHRGRLDPSGHHHRGARRLVHGLRALQAHQGHPAVDALDQDAAGGRRALPDLPAVHSAGRSGHRGALVIVLMLINLPIIVWMLYTYFREIPGEILEAARMDGATPARRDPLRADADGDPGHRLHRASELHPRLERGVLDAEPDGGRRGAADGLHRQLLQPRGPVLRQAQRGLDHGHRADPHPWAGSARNNSSAA
jgi:hypothetical protein